MANKYMKDYEAAHDRITVMFDKGTKDRIKAASNGMRTGDFIKLSVSFMLNCTEKWNAEMEELECQTTKE